MDQVEADAGKCIGAQGVVGGGIKLIPDGRNQ
jgi:hypothetical protein